MLRSLGVPFFAGHGRPADCRVERKTRRPSRAWRPLIAVVGLLATAQGAWGQANSAIPTIIPPSPTAAALEKYGKVPVSTYTGVPNISVPLYEVKVRDLSIPISLSYHAGGFRVAEEASWVGLGWSLLAGGAITRTVRNLDDLQYFVNTNPTKGYPYAMPDPSGTRDPILSGDPNIPDVAFFGNGFNDGDTYSGARAMVHSCQRLVVNGVFNSDALCGRIVGPLFDVAADWEPDDFRFSMGGHSGQFAFRQDGSIHVLEQQKVKIVPPVRGQPGSGWQITTPDGFEYYFTAQEATVAITPVQQQQSITTTWYLTRIVSPLGEEATLSYRRGAAAYAQTALTQNEMIHSLGGADCAAVMSNGGGSASMGWVIPQYLHRIAFKTGTVDFERDTLTERADLRGGQRLKRIVVYDAAHRLQKAFDLQTSYFITPPTTTGEVSNLPFNDPGVAYEGARLRLDAVAETGQDGYAKPATTFAYNTTALPIKSSFSVDFWGFFNGVRNTSLLPEYAGPDLYGFYIFRPGANRRAVAAPMQACILEKITYPTGGSTSFAFEPHSYSNTTDADFIITQQHVPLRFAEDNVEPGNSIPNDSSFSVTVPTPLALNYTLTAYNRDSKVQTKLVLIDDATGRPLVYTQDGMSPSQNGQLFSRIWGFPDISHPTYPAGDVFRGQDNILLPPGRYHFAAQLMFMCGGTAPRSYCHGAVYVTASYDRMVRASATEGLPLAGGLRVRRIEDVDGMDARRKQVRVYEYGAGTLMNRPVFTSRADFGVGTAGVPVMQCAVLQRLSYNQSCFSAGAQGNTVGYPAVTVLEGDQGQGGKTEYRYHCLPDREPRYSNRQPSIPVRSDDLNGSLLLQTTYRKTDAGYQLLTKTENEYESVNRYDLPGMHRGAWFHSQGIAAGIGLGLYMQPFYFYALGSRWVRLVQTTSRQYDPQDPSKALTTTTRYSYDTLKAGHMQVSQVKTQRSDGSILLTNTTYPADYAAVASGPLAQMRSDAVFQHTAVVESISRVYQAGQPAAEAKTVAGSYTEYARPSPTAKFLPVAQRALELSRPQAGFGVAAPNLPLASRYALRAQLSYDPGTANLRQARRPQDGPTSFVWGYAHTLPLASIQNASAAQVEAALVGLSTSLATLGALTDEEQLRRTFAQLRTRLPQARITSFTYRPLTGVSSQTDPSGRTTTYEYDGFGRLARTRDEQGRIRAEQQYHYAQP